MSRTTTSAAIPSDIEIAQAAKLRPIVDVAAELGLAPEQIEPYGHTKAKVNLDVLAGAPARGRLVLVTGTNPTPAGEGKTTVTVGLAQALRRLGVRVTPCIREPSLGPLFGIKGGAAGGGYSQIVPMEDLNLHFTGDMHAVTSAHLLLSAMLDNHLHHGKEPLLDPRRVLWKRCVDMNDRALREIVVGLGGPGNGVPRQDGFVITAASEIMAVLCLAEGVEDLERRLGEILIGYTRDRQPVRAKDLAAQGAMTLLLADALKPNLVQTLEGGPAFVHGGPFGNIAQGCSSILATRAGLALADVVLTEAGFGSELGAEKFFHIKCRAGGLEPAAAVLVTSVRALKMNGGAPREALADENLQALGAGLPNLDKHVENLVDFGVPPVVAVNRFPTDTRAEIEAVVARCEEKGVRAAPVDVVRRGGEGGEELAKMLMEAIGDGAARLSYFYDLESPIKKKIEAIASRVYGGDGVDYDARADRSIAELEELGLGTAPICMAKTQYSLSDDPKLLGRPRGFRLRIMDAVASAGAGFVVALAGDILRMPGLPRVPAACDMRIAADGTIEGLQ